MPDDARLKARLATLQNVSDNYKERVGHLMEAAQRGEVEPLEVLDDLAATFALYADAATEIMVRLTLEVVDLRQNPRSQSWENH